MTLTKRALVCPALGTLFVFATERVTSAPGASSSISGVVVDSAGGTIPGATVVVKSEAGASYETTTNTEGVFSVPAVTAGTYTVTVSLAGFKTAIISDIRIAPGTPASVKARSEERRVGK